MKEVLDLEIRRQIYSLIVKNPGIHAREIAQMLSVSGQLTDYHLLCMERQDLITAVKEEGYRRYYCKGKLGIKERRRIAILRQEIPLKIVLHLLKHPNLKHREVLEYFDISKSTLSYHLKKLVKHEIISEHIIGRAKEYKVINEKEIMELLIRYKPYSRKEALKDAWVDLKWPGTP